MRLAFVIHSIEDITCSVSVFDASGVLDIMNPNSVLLTWVRSSRSDSHWNFYGASMKDISSHRANILKQVIKVCTALGSPLMTCRHIVEDGGVQLVESNGKLSIIRSKSEKTEFSLVGIDLSVEAGDEKEAKRIGKYKVATHMASDSENADKLVTWFSSGCPVKKIEDDDFGATPIAISELAANSNTERETAKTAVIKKFGKKD